MQKAFWLKSDNGDSIIIVKVKTNQNEEQFIFDEENLVIRITAPPIKGRANRKLLKLLRKKFRTEVTLESGHTSSKKVFRLKKLSNEQVLEFLGSYQSKTNTHKRSRG